MEQRPSLLAGAACSPDACTHSRPCTPIPSLPSRAVDTQGDSLHCGACDQDCLLPSLAGTCTLGVCDCDTAAGFTDCGAYCADLAADLQNCGACGNVCPQGNVCAFDDITQNYECKCTASDQCNAATPICASDGICKRCDEAQVGSVVDGDFTCSVRAALIGSEFSAGPGRGGAGPACVHCRPPSALALADRRRCPPPTNAPPMPADTEVRCDTTADVTGGACVQCIADDLVVSHRCRCVLPCGIALAQSVRIHPEAPGATAWPPRFAAPLCCSVPPPQNGDPNDEACAFLVLDNAGRAASTAPVPNAPTTCQTAGDAWSYFSLFYELSHGTTRESLSSLHGGAKQVASASKGRGLGPRQAPPASPPMLARPLTTASPLPPPPPTCRSQHPHHCRHQHVLRHRLHLRGPPRLSGAQQRRREPATLNRARRQAAWLQDLLGASAARRRPSPPKQPHPYASSNES